MLLHTAVYTTPPFQVSHVWRSSCDAQRLADGTFGDAVHSRAPLLRDLHVIPPSLASMSPFDVVQGGDSALPWGVGSSSSSSSSTAAGPSQQRVQQLQAQAGSAPAALGLVPVTAYSVSEGQLLGDTLRQAGKSAVRGGLPGAAAMGVQVLSLMWLRTTINYQYRYGGTLSQAFKALHADGGLRRFYRGVSPALILGPLSRFGDTASNAGMLALLASYEQTAGLPVGAQTLAASAVAGCFRVLLMPVDALKTTLQVEGKDGGRVLASKVRASGPAVLYHGALAAAAATWAGHFPWFFVYNGLSEALPQYDDLPQRLLRSAAIGFAASLVSDCTSNSIRVVKTTKQTSKVALSYADTVREIVQADGVTGLFTRGLQTKILANGLQGLLFSVMWRLGQDFVQQHGLLQ